MLQRLRIWFPTIRVGSGADVFTERLAGALERRNIRTKITWLPHKAEYVPWIIPIPGPPAWANVVHINSWLHSRFLPTGLPLVVTLHSCVHDPALESYKSLPQSFYHRFWIKIREAETIRRANAVTAVSRYTADRAAAVFGRNDIIPIHNWIDVEDFQPDDRQIPNTPFRLLFVGNLNRRKGVDLLPEIMRRLGSGFELHYTGTEEELGNPNDMPPNVTALGRLISTTALVDAYRASDALLFPTRLEGFGLVALESQACGRPVITTDGSSLPEVVERDKSGFLCPINDVDAFVTAARQLGDHPILWRQMCINASKRASQEFSEESAIEQYLDLYDRILMSR